MVELKGIGKENFSMERKKNGQNIVSQSHCDGISMPEADDSSFENKQRG
jgi:hypothetical protein